MTNTAPIDVPQAIQQGAKLMWWSLGLGVLVTLIQVGALLSIKAPIATTLVELLGYIFLGLFIKQIGKGRNWARWLYACMVGLGLVMLLGKLIFGPTGSFAGTSWFFILIMLVRSLLDIGALVLIFDLSANRWFDSKKAIKE
jgi:hypothetical protein